LITQPFPQIFFNHGVHEFSSALVFKILSAATAGALCIRTSCNNSTDIGIGIGIDPPTHLSPQLRFCGDVKHEDDDDTESSRITLRTGVAGVLS
jgi:hypothetical protein